MLVLLPIFFTVESARAALWTARAAYNRDGGLLCALFAVTLGILGMVPSPMWTIVIYAAHVAWVPFRGVLWVWGIGRGGSKKRECVFVCVVSSLGDADVSFFFFRTGALGYPIAVTRWYMHTRARRAEALRRRRL